MPEGPEIHRIASRLAEALAGDRAEEVYFAFEHLKRYQGELTGERIRRVEARGKAVLTSFSNGLTVYSHNQLYGKWFVTRRGDVPKTKRQLRFSVATRLRSAHLYSASEIEVLDPEGLRSHPYLSRLGPDLLDPDLSESDVLERLGSERFVRRQLGHLLLDQSFLAGVGNYLRSEILHAARIHPSKRPADLGKRERRRLAAAALAVSRRSLETGGITNEPARVRKLSRRGVRRSEYRFLAYARAGKDCYRCRTEIVGMRVGSRTLYACPECQSP